MGCFSVLQENEGIYGTRSRRKSLRLDKPILLNLPPRNTNPTKRKDKTMSKIPIGLQMYTVRDLCEKDFIGALRGVADIGYAGIELAGTYGLSAPELRDVLDELGLKCVGNHSGERDLDKLVEFNQTIGCEYVGGPALPPGGFPKDEASCLAAAKHMNEASIFWTSSMKIRTPIWSTQKLTCTGSSMQMSIRLRISGNIRGVVHWFTSRTWAKSVNLLKLARGFWTGMTSLRRARRSTRDGTSSSKIGATVRRWKVPG